MLLEEMMSGGWRFRKPELTRAIDIAYHHGSNIDSKDVIAMKTMFRNPTQTDKSRGRESSRIGEEANTSDDDDLGVKPTGEKGVNGQISLLLSLSTYEN